MTLSASATEFMLWIYSDSYPNDYLVVEWIVLFFFNFHCSVFFHWWELRVLQEFRSGDKPDSLATSDVFIILHVLYENSSI